MFVVGKFHGIRQPLWRTLYAVVCRVGEAAALHYNAHIRHLNGLSSHTTRSAAFLGVAGVAICYSNLLRRSVIKYHSGWLLLLPGVLCLRSYNSHQVTPCIRAAWSIDGNRGQSWLDTCRHLHSHEVPSCPCWSGTDSIKTYCSLCGVR